MKWESHSEYTLRQLLGDDTYESWAEAVRDDEISGFSKHLDELLSRLAGVALSEFEIEPGEKAKIVRLMELAALAGRKL
jgi:hypothetical protein